MMGKLQNAEFCKWGMDRIGSLSESRRAIKAAPAHILDQNILWLQGGANENTWQNSEIERGLA